MYRPITRVLAVAVSSTFAFAPTLSLGFTVTVNGTAATSCGTPIVDGAGNITINCSTTGTAVCTVSASPSSVPSNGGTVTVTASNCGTISSWTKSGSLLSQSSTQWQDTIPGNQSSSSKTFVYTVNGTASASVTQAGTGSTAPPPGNISCSNIPGITSTQVVSLSWNHVSGLTSTNKIGGFPPGKAFVFQFTPPAGYSSTSTGRFNIVPTDGNGYNSRYMAISATPCDLSGSLAKGAVAVGYGTSIYFSVGAYAQKSYFGRLVDDTSVPRLNAGQTYYVTIVQETTPGGENTCFYSSCDLNYSLYNPSGT